VVVKSAVPNTNDEIEVIAESGPWGRIRIRESQGISGIAKCSIFLPPDQLEDHARECLALATKIRNGQVASEMNTAKPVETTETTEAARANYLGMTIEQYRRAIRREGH
jgi:hypothetical protein